MSSGQDDFYSNWGSLKGIQYKKVMIPHYSSAILVSQQATCLGCFKGDFPMGLVGC
ncbi:hypothetical protein AB9P05_16670 [Roseivirga sp. BDSF3-8]|uniref:hypothetical protein n=1 Tax=Roseivirga sp. BDSF3-8 TaxID=3241598 RepID=UPI003531807D